MNDDFNTPILIANLFEGVKHINLVKQGKETISNSDKELLVNTLNTFVFEVLGLELSSEQGQDSSQLHGVVHLLIQLRNEARANKDFDTSDKIRDELAELGIQLKDSKEGTTFSTR